MDEREDEVIGREREVVLVFAILEACFRLGLGISRAFLTIRRRDAGRFINHGHPEGGEASWSVARWTTTPRITTAAVIPTRDEVRKMCFCCLLLFVFLG